LSVDNFFNTVEFPLSGTSWTRQVPDYQTFWTIRLPVLIRVTLLHLLYLSVILISL